VLTKESLRICYPNNLSVLAEFRLEAYRFLGHPLMRNDYICLQHVFLAALQELNFSGCVAPQDGDAL
jgi:hypothetical protein